MVVSRAMPVPICHPKTGCPLYRDWTVLTRIHNSTQTAHT
jgi:hypothetical protein